MAFETRISLMDVDFTSRGPPITQSTIQQLIDQYLGEFKGAIVNHVTAQVQVQGPLLEEPKGDIEVTIKVPVPNVPVCFTIQVPASHHATELRQRAPGTGPDFTSWGPPVTQSTIQQLIDQHLGELKGAVVNHVITGCQDQGRLLKEAKRDLEVFRKAYYKAEREAQDREARFELEKEALEDEIRRLRAILAHEKRVEHQRPAPPVPADTRQHATVWSGAKTT